ncbi:MAG: LacI family DNA-binding transcriptional regulator [Anaerolineales bacterium]
MVDKTVRTIADLARLAGVSKSTVSRALSDSPLISAETRQRIQALAQQHHFRLNQAARQLTMQKSRTVAFVTHVHYQNNLVHVSHLNPFFMDILSAASFTLANNGYDLLMAHVDYADSDWPQRYVDTGKADGFILIASSRKLQLVQTLRKAGAPFVVWGLPLENLPIPSVTGDNLMGGRLATEHLLQRGRQRIACLGGPQDDYEAHQRYLGYEMALQAADKTVDSSLLAYGDYTSESGAQAMHQLLQQAPDLDAVFASSDAMAIAAIRVLQTHGRRVPADVAVVGYDDLPTAQYNTPPLTTIRQNLERYGQLLAENLIRYLEIGEVVKSMVPVQLIVRASSGE